MALTERFGISGADLRARGHAVLRPCTARLESMVVEREPHLVHPAIQALGKLGDPLSAEVLYALFDEADVAEDAVAAAARVAAPGVVERLLGAVPSSSPPVLAAIAGVVGRWRGDPRILAALAPLLSSTHANVRRAALRGLVELAAPAARDVVVPLLDDPDPEMVVGAVKVLGAGGLAAEPDRALDLLEPLFDRAQEARVRASVVALFEGVTSDRLMNLLKKACRDANPRVRANAVEVIGASAVGDRRKLALLKPMIQEGENNRVLANLAIALGSADTDAALQILSRLLNSTEKWERASAVYAARFVKTERVAAWLTTLFTSEDDPDVLRNVLESLAKFGTAEVSGCFVKALEHQNPLVRSGAARALGRIHDLSLLDRLVQSLEKEQDVNVICEILSALGKLADASRIPLVAQYLQHTDIRVQANAIEALESLGTVEIVPFAEPFLNSSDNRVKANAAVALWTLGSLNVVASLHDMLCHQNLKQRGSAVYAVGELGEALRRLEGESDRYLMLISALKEEEADAAATAQASLGDPDEARGPSTTQRYDFAALRAAGVSVPGAPPAEEPGADDFPLEELEQYFALLAEYKVKEAMAHLQACLDRYPGNTWLLYLKADGFRLQKNLPRACEGFRELTRHHAHGVDFVNAYVHLANIYRQSQELPQSLEAYFMATRAQLAVLQRQVDMGLKLLEERDVNEASLLLKSVVSQVPLNSRIHYAAGRSFLKGRYHEDAAVNLMRAYLTAPNNGEVLLGLAFACYKTGRHDAVRHLADKLTRLLGPASPLAQKARELVLARERAGA